LSRDRAEAHSRRTASTRERVGANSLTRLGAR